jgi:hypothetical protein
MRLAAASMLVAVVVLSGSPSTKTPAFDGSGNPLFDRPDPVELTLEAPIQKLFENGKDNEDYTVRGTLSLKPPGAQADVFSDVEISVRGNTSKRESECPFPKLKLKLPEKKASSQSSVNGLESLKIGTHCGEAKDTDLTKRFGRLANEKTAWREALVYRILDAAAVPTLKARPARITYIEPGIARDPLVRNGMVIEDDDDAKKRLGAKDEIAMEKFGNARDRFSEPDAAKVAFAEAMIGNFDWCLKFSPEDTYRCDARKPLWNILALQHGDAVIPLIKDFDLSGIVTGRHPWFGDVFNEAFVPSKAHIDVEVISQVQRTRSLFGRDRLDRTRKDFLSRRQAIERAIADAAVDPAGRDLARKYLRAFFDAIGSDATFYRRVVTRPGTRLYRDAAKSGDACGAGETLPIGTPVNELRRSGAMTEVVALDALWQWAPPTTCHAVRAGTVWIDSSAVSADYPNR